METIKAWQEVFSLSYGREWVKIPDRLVSLLELPKGIGISGGILCTKKSALGANSFIDRLNKIGGS
jgi:hypothetical protein